MIGTLETNWKEKRKVQIEGQWYDLMDHIKDEYLDPAVGQKVSFSLQDNMISFIKKVGSDGGNPTQNNYPKKTYPKKEFKPANKTGVDWDSVSRGKCKHAYLVEAYKMGKDLSLAEKEAEAWANASMRFLGEKEEEYL